MARSIDLGNPFVPSLDGMVELLLVRHGEQKFVADMPIGEGVDAPLSSLGCRQADALGRRLAGTDIAAIYSSDAVRAHDTGAAVAAHHGLDVRVDPDLAEINLWAGVPPDQGLVEHLGADEVRRIYRSAAQSRTWDAYPHSEDPAAFRARSRTAIDRIAAAHDGERVVVACHGGVINTYLAGLSGADHDLVVSVHHTSITTVRADGDRRAVVAVNDYAHVLEFQDDLDPLNVA